MESRMQEIRTYGLMRGNPHRKIPRRNALLHPMADANSQLETVNIGTNFPIGGSPFFDGQKSLHPCK